MVYIDLSFQSGVVEETGPLPWPKLVPWALDGRELSWFNYLAHHHCRYHIPWELPPLHCYASREVRELHSMAMRQPSHLQAEYDNSHNMAVIRLSHLQAEYDIPAALYTPIIKARQQRNGEDGVSLVENSLYDKAS